MKPPAGNYHTQMPMKKYVAIVCTSLLIPILGMAQGPSKAAKKLQKLYVKNPAKCVDYARKVVSNREERELAYYYLAIAQHQLFTSTNKKPALNSSIRYLGEFYKVSKNPTAIEDRALIQEIKESVVELVENAIEKKKYRTALKYSKKHIILFSDTLEQHAFIVKKLVKPPKCQSQI